MKVEKVIVIIQADNGKFHQVVMTDNQMDIVKTVIQQPDGSVKALDRELELEIVK